MRNLAKTVKKQINVSLAKIGKMNVNVFVENLDGNDAVNARSILNLLESSTIEENELDLSVNDTLDYLREYYQFDDHNVYNEFVQIVGRAVLWGKV